MVVGDSLPVLFAPLVGKSLAADIYQVVLIVVVATVFVCYAGKEDGCLSGILWVVIVAHLACTTRYEVVSNGSHGVYQMLWGNFLTVEKPVEFALNA